VSEALLVDTSALLCLLAEGGEHHRWAAGVVRKFQAPALTTEPVLTETAYLLVRFGQPATAIFRMMDDRGLRIGLSVEAERAALRSLMERYRDVPMSLADATLVRLSELNANSRIFTLDADFRIYRRYGNKVIPVVMPEE
jgi:predicted nucleic acid-binding protein